MNASAPSAPRPSPLPVQAPSLRTRLHWSRHVARALIIACLIGSAFFGAGLVRFAEALPRPRPSSVTADAVVVLTGGESRVAKAVDLIASGQGRRLLISGVNDHTSAGAIADATDQNQALFRCCIDIDRRARNTVGNAAEIARWVNAHGYRSVIVVTGAYHMPRALNELRNKLPGVRLYPDPVLAPGLDLDSWWADERTVRLIMVEYAKYLVSEVRTRLSLSTEAFGNL
ncbi:MAG: YdcF family protein [Hyphomicrobiales bacterium]|nr:YdcF family protein [Hyphomicrobiales bacterium]MBV9113914.1 YdcF family protein [Hyphomicrobiales bacterium]MBV9517542.1 YdcF family protein [Hyphomicrobiales bacterium]